MRLLVLSDVTGYMKGGVPVETSRLVGGLVSRGHDVAVVSDIPLRGTEAAEHFPIAVPINALLSEQLGRAVAAFGPDVVHVMAMSSRGMVKIAPVLRSRPWVMTCHSLSPFERKLPAFHGNERLHYGVRALRFLPHTLAWRWLMKSGSIPQVVVHSRFMEKLAKRYGQPEDRISLIPLGHTASLAAGGDDPNRAIDGAPRIVTVGGLAHTKGLHDMVTAIGSLLPRFPRLRYRIIGEPRDESYISFLHAEVDRLSLASNVTIEQHLSDEQKTAALRAADIYVQPSHEEGFCLSYIEAAAVVARLVGTDTGAIAAISQGDRGMRVVQARDPAALAARVRDLIDTCLAPDLMVRRRERLDRLFGWIQYLDAHEALYSRIHAH